MWPLTLGFAMRDSESLARAGYSGDPLEQADQLFDAIISQHSSVVFSRDTIDASWERLGNDGRVHCHTFIIEEMKVLEAGPADRASSEFPFALSVGRRDYTAN